MPDTDESLTKHLLTTDWFHSREELNAIAASVKAGAQIEFPPENMQAFWVSKAEHDAQDQQLRRACVIGCLVLLVIIAVAVLMIWAW